MLPHLGVTVRESEATPLASLYIELVCNLLPRATDLPMILRRSADFFDLEEGNSAVDEAMRFTFVAYPRNDQLTPILMKAALVNSLYHTNIFDIYSVGKHILEQNIDPLLDEGDLAAVERLRLGHGVLNKGTEADFYSFSTKYCHWHRQDAYPVFDRFAKEAIQWLDDHASLGMGVSDRSLHDVFELRKTVEACRKIADPNWQGFKQIDKALWTLGRFLDSEISDTGLRQLIPETSSH